MDVERSFITARGKGTRQENTRLSAADAEDASATVTPTARGAGAGCRGRTWGAGRKPGRPSLTPPCEEALRSELPALLADRRFETTSQNRDDVSQAEPNSRTRSVTVGAALVNVSRDDGRRERRRFQQLRGQRGLRGRLRAKRSVRRVRTASWEGRSSASGRLSRPLTPGPTDGRGGHAGSGDPLRGAALCSGGHSAASPNAIDEMPAARAWQS